MISRRLPESDPRGHLVVRRGVAVRHLTEDGAPHRVVGTVKNCRSEECDREENKDRDGSGSHDTEQHRGAADHHGESEEGKEERRDHGLRVPIFLRPEQGQFGPQPAE